MKRERERSRALLLQAEAVLWRRQVGLSPSWQQLDHLWRELEAIERYWQERDERAAEGGR